MVCECPLCNGSYHDEGGWWGDFSSCLSYLRERLERLKRPRYFHKSPKKLVCLIGYEGMEFARDDDVRNVGDGSCG